MKVNKSKKGLYLLSLLALLSLLGLLCACQPKEAQLLTMRSRTGRCQLAAAVW